MQVVALSVKEAEEFLAKHERHYKAPAEPICAIGVAGMEKAEGASGPADLEFLVLHGAAILGRKNKNTGELCHIYVDGASQGYSLLYGACWRALKALGYEKTML